MQLRSAKATSNSGGGSSGRRGEELQAKMEVIEKEARVLRERNAQLESENEKLQQGPDAIARKVTGSRFP